MTAWLIEQSIKGLFGLVIFGFGYVAGVMTAPDFFAWAYRRKSVGALREALDEFWRTR